MASFEYGLNYLEAGLEILESYLLSKELYWPIGIRAPRGKMPYPKFTLGNLLLEQVKVHALCQTLKQELLLEEVSKKISTVHNKWRIAWNKKASHEFQARLSLWSNFINEYRKDPEANYDRYRYEVSRRVLLELLSGYLDDEMETEHTLLKGLDQYLESVLVSSDFIWDPDLISQFPYKPYWYLYGLLKA